MQPTEILSGEHRVIECVLGSLERMSEEAAGKTSLDKRSFAEAMAFFRDYADRCHHGKEEHLLFPLMEKRGIARKNSPLGGMRFDHMQGRSLVGTMRQAAETAFSREGSGFYRLVSSARDYCQLLRKHIEKEDTILFPMVDETFSNEDSLFLLAAFQKMEDGLFGPEFHRKYTAIADALSEKYCPEIRREPT
jgi:hemerythrin-like domain-containing protein